jgi:phytoene dehydrogenase-like protein
MTGRRVLVLEKAPHIGGSMARFHRRGVPFDTGFHFTGGFSPDGLLTEALTVLGLRDTVTPIFMDPNCAHRLVFESEDRVIDLPAGIPAMRRALKGYFPAEASAIEAYFDRVVSVCAGTRGMNLSTIGAAHRRLEEDTVSLHQVVSDLTDNRLLQAVFCCFGMCYGVPPSEVSFASHCRVCLGLYESTARIAGGGQALADAFAERLRALGVEIRCGRHVAGCADIRGDSVHRFVLNTGEEIAFDTCLFTIHPHEVLRILPREHLSRAFVERVKDFESSAGFFAVFGVLNGETCEPDFGTNIVSLFPSTDFDWLLNPANRTQSALVIIRSIERVQSRTRPVVTAFEPSFPEHVREWAHSRTGHRPPAYRDYKAERVRDIRRRLEGFVPAYRGTLDILDAASVLTFRDYLHSPDGSAYGVKQKLGQMNLVGKLPLRNLYAAGQSAVLPGVVGAIMSSFVVCRTMIGKEPFDRLIGERLCR